MSDCDVFSTTHPWVLVDTLCDRNSNVMSARHMDANELHAYARRIRKHVVRMCSGPEGGHLGGSMSIADILAVLYGEVLRVDSSSPSSPTRDIFVLSKGHAAPALYAALAERAFFPIDWLSTFGQPNSPLMGHPVRSIPGVEAPTGSLGHGLALTIGFAIAAQADGSSRRCVCLLGDGELQEGSVWEAIMAAGALRLPRMTAIVDRNQLQITGRTENTIALEPLSDRFAAFGWRVVTIDGHDIEAIGAALSEEVADPRPTVIIAKTTKGKGITFVEGRVQSHFVKLQPKQERACLDMLEGIGGT